MDGEDFKPFKEEGGGFTLARELQLTINAVREGGKLAQNMRDQGYKVRYKEGNQGAVTDADHAVSALLLATIAQEFPDDLFISEEVAEPEGATQSGRIWYIDPIDGTQEFIENSDEWSIMVGLAIHGRAALGVVYQPDQEKLYYAARNQGAFLSTAGDLKALQVSSITQTEDAVLIQSRSHWSRKADEAAKNLGIVKRVKLGSIGLKLGKIAEAEADLYFNFSHRCHLWDLCAPEAILTEASGVLVLSSGERVFYGKEETQMKESFLATNQHLLDKVYPCLQ